MCKNSSEEKKTPKLKCLREPLPLYALGSKLKGRKKRKKKDERIRLRVGGRKDKLARRSQDESK